MRLMFDDEYEEIDSSIRRYDDNKYCLFLDIAKHSQDDVIIDVHWHEWLEIIYVINGNMTVITPQGSWHVKKNQIIVIGTNVLHKIIGKTGYMRFQCLHVNNGFILQHMSTSLLIDKVFMIEDKTYFLELWAEIILKMNHIDLISQLEYKSSLLQLLAQCLKENHYNLKQYENWNNDTFSKILFYVSTHYREDISLKHLSEYFHYTTQHISLMFKRYLHINYYVYLTKLRLDRAKLLLMTTDKRIIDIALECGFSSEHGLINHFKKWYGKTPSQYRKDNVGKYTL